MVEEASQVLIAASFDAPALDHDPNLSGEIRSRSRIMSTTKRGS
jgi:hypothetical protein